ncbi:hypothetical protein H6F61_13125 [Cyanobacteria bacterium FACHB-472]|nr:hypothetical protein [Cyanobacteria bacterium FACHB-472]
MTTKLAVTKPDKTQNRWLGKLIAIIALVNFCFVVFDLSYVSWRDFYLHHWTSITQVYDPIKGIEPHRETQNYLNKVDELETQVLQNGLQSSPVENLLQELRTLSNEMIEDNPFAVANKSGILEKIKTQIRDRVNIKSSHKAFALFWSQEYLSQAGWQQELNFFNTKTRPLIQTNYYRNIGTNGKFIDNFWQIDLPFVIVFALDFLTRTFSISRRSPGLNWFKAMLRRWYDIFFLLPFLRWLRVIPLTLRLHQADLLNLELVRREINHDLVANFAEEMTEIVGIGLIAQMQESIGQGDVARWLLHPETRRPYIQVNNTDEVKAIATRLVNLSVYDVLPQIQPDIEALVHHTLKSTLNQSPVYQQLQNIPGLNHLPTQFTERLAKDLSQSTYSNLKKALEDPVVGELSSRLLKNFRDALEKELQKKHNLQEIQSLLVDMLEEIKINYVRGIAEAGVEKILEEADHLHQIIHH